MNTGIKIILMSFFCAFLPCSKLVAMHNNKEKSETIIYFQDDLDVLFGHFLTAKDEKPIEQIDFCIPYKFGISIEKLFPELHDLNGKKKEYLGKDINAQDWLNLLCEKLDAESRRSKRASLDTETVLGNIRLQKLARKKVDAAKKKSAVILAQQKLGKSSLSGIKKTRKKNR